jgi:uncharacterized repeat protein (TIGR02543 family)
MNYVKKYRILFICFVALFVLIGNNVVSFSTNLVMKGTAICHGDMTIAVIKFNSNGGNNLENVVITPTRPSHTTTLPVPVRDGYIFDGWYYDYSFNKKVSADSILSPYESMICLKTINITLYAKWIEDTSANEDENFFVGDVVVGRQCVTGVATRVIYFNTNGGNEIKEVSISSKILSDYSLPTPVKDGYIFDGWYYDNSLTSVVDTNDLRNVNYTPKVDEYDCTIPDEVTLYAKWKVNKPVEGSNNEDKEPEKNSNDVPSKKPEKDTNDSTSKCPINVPTRTITFESDGGSSFDSVSISKDSIEKYDLPVPVKDGYDFLGWYYDKELLEIVFATDLKDVRYNEQKDKKGCVVTDKVTLYAKWISSKIPKEKYVVRYHDGTNVEERIYITYEGGKNLLILPKKTGYSFDGWYYGEDFSEKVEVDYIEQLKYDVLLEEKSIELYAKWNIDEVYNEIDIDTGNEKEIVNKRVDKTLIVGICIIFILLLILIICIIKSRKKENDFNSY